MSQTSGRRVSRWTLLAIALLVIVFSFVATMSAQNDPTTKQPVFREPTTIVPSMNGGAPSLLRAIVDDQMVPRLLRKRDGTTEVIEEMSITHTWDRVVPGNTYRIMPGENLKINVVNDLKFPFTIQQLVDKRILGNNDPLGLRKFIHASMNITNLHVHGLHVSPQGFQDNVLLYANPGRQIPYSYDVPSIHAPGTHWYHPHHHGSTALQVTEGMVGGLIVGEPPMQNLTPTGWSALERLLIIRAGGAESIEDLPIPADMDPALKSILSEESQPRHPDVAKLKSAIAARIGPSPELENFLGELSEQNQLDAIVQIVEDVLQPRTLTVNGQLNPVDEVQPGQLVRMRIINAGSRVGDYKDYFLDGHNIFLAAMDGINLRNLPKGTGPGSFAGYVAYNNDRKLTLAPGNRADVYFIAQGIGRHALVAETVAKQGGLVLSSQEVMTFEVTRGDFSSQPSSTEADDNTLRRFLGDLDKNLTRLQGIGAYATGQYLSDVTREPVNAERTVVFAAGPRQMNRPFAVNRRNYNGPMSDDGEHDMHSDMPGSSDYLGKMAEDGGRGPKGETPWPIRRGTVEKWTIRNTSNGRHPFHIHVNPAWVVGIVENGRPVPAGDPRLGRWQDTIDLPAQANGVPGEVTVLQRFTDYEGLFVLHCHILQHEDRGMMINVLIMPRDLSGAGAPEAFFKQQKADNDKLNCGINPEDC